MKAKMVTFKSVNGDKSIDRLFEGQNLLVSNGINIGDTGMWVGGNARDIQVPSNQTDKVVKILNNNGFEVVKIENDIDIEEEKEKKGDENIENKEDSIKLLIGNYRLIQKLGLEVIRELENLGYNVEKVDLVKRVEYDQTCFIRIYTEHHIYSILATQSSDITIKEQYIGGSVMYRKPFKEELWTTGYDLLHGQYNDKIWNEIKEAIINEEKDNSDPIKYEKFYLDEE